MKQTLRGLGFLSTIPAVLTYALAFSVSCSSTTPSDLSDTTSHAFIWSFESIGESGRLDDVCIISDTLAYAVGELYARDSLGQWEHDAYNVVRWDGRTWTKLRVRVFGSCSVVEYPPLYGMWALSANEIYLTHGGGIAKFNGVSATLDCRMLPLITGGLMKIFAVDSRNIYSVGRSGTIVHFDGQGWQKIDAGTNLLIADIFGARHPFTGQLTILVIGSGSSASEGKKVLQIRGTTVTALSDSGLSWSLSGLWFVPSVSYYVVGAGLFSKKDLAEEIWRGHPAGEITSWATTDIRGNGANDILAVGSGFEVVHFNGSTWCNYRDQIPSTNGIFTRVAMRGNLAIAVGAGSNRGAIAVGHR